MTVLKEVVQTFQAEHGRTPTFWLDKSCIDQTSIQDGLRVLPINIMAAAQVLVLCGETYCTRLWCVWELYVVFMFSKNDIMDKVVVHGLSDMVDL